MAVFPPKGFIRHDRESPLTAPWGPIYSRVDEDRVRLGLAAEIRHTNSRGLVHGGLIAALADNAMGLSCRLAGVGLDLVTVSLSLDYLQPAQQGAWLEVQPSVARVGRVLSFASAVILSGDAICAQAHGTYRSIARASQIDRQSEN